MMKRTGDYFKRQHKWLFSIVAVGIALCFAACKSNDEVAVTSPFDPSKAVTITDFVPKTGGGGQRLVVYGSNFGTDTSLVKVMVGGMPAVLVSVKGNALYCYVPSKAYSGKIQVSVGRGDSTQTATATENFSYEKKMVAGTLCGYKNARGDQGWQDGPFATCSGFSLDGVLKFDPLNKTHLYVCYDGADIQLLDLKNRMLTTPISRSNFGNQRLRDINFTNDGQYMLVTVDANYAGMGRTPSEYILKRNADGTFNNASSINLIAAYGSTNGAAIHPVNGELYFNSYERGQIFRLDMNKYFDTILNGKQWGPNFSDGNYTELFTIQDVGWETKIFIHPSGKYAYLLVVNQAYILRTDYNEATKSFAPPYVVAGEARSGGWTDGVGTSARLSRPYQGVFVKNPDYVAAGRDDQYDFYFCDSYNDCIRILTPEGIVKTYAGRGNTTTVTDNHTFGNEDGDLRQVARFWDPTGIVYDEASKTFYILDRGNCEMRTISLEK
jgi:hypothetical protein